MSNPKFQRNYRVTIQPIDSGAPLIITPPLTMQINLNRVMWGGMSTLSLDLFNLSTAHQRRIYQDKNVYGQYFNSPIVESGASPQFENITVEMGYGEQLQKVFDGHVMGADSRRRHTEIVTHIEASSFLFDMTGTQINQAINASPEAPVTAKTILQTIAAQFPNLKIGAIGDFPAQFTRPVVLNGPAWGLLQLYSEAPLKAACYIDGNKIFILNNQEVTGGILVIDDSTGILDTPERQYNLLIVRTLLETGASLIGQQVKIASTVMPVYNGIYKVLAIRYYGIISGAVSGRMISEFVLQASGQYGTASQPGQGFTVVPSAQAVAA